MFLWCPCYVVITLVLSCFVKFHHKSLIGNSVGLKPVFVGMRVGAYSGSIPDCLDKKCFGLLESDWSGLLGHGRGKAPLHWFQSIEGNGLKIT